MALDCTTIVCTSNSRWPNDHAELRVPYPTCERNKLMIERIAVLEGPV